MLRSIIGTVSHAACLFSLPLALLVSISASTRAESDIPAIVNRIDQLLAERWVADGIEPAPRCEDAEFLRRVYLDLTGVTPSVSQVREFLESDDADKRGVLVDQLLESPRHATHLAITWRNILLPAAVDPSMLAEVTGLQSWLRSQFAQNLPYDALVAKFLVADRIGGTGPGVFYTAHELRPEKLAAKTAQVFLGVQMQCAECHDHPFDEWSQTDFWAYAAFFAQLDQRTVGRNQMPQQLVDVDRGDVVLPDTDEVVPPKYPGGRHADPSEGGSRRMQLSIWTASRDNPYLARACVNRVWGHLFGRGLVEPIDDMGEQNQPSHPALLNELADHFSRTGFDLRNLYRILAKTQAYQLASCDGDSPNGAKSFARMNLKTLRAEQLFDSLERFQVPAPTVENTRRDLLGDSRRLRFVTQMRMQSRNPRDFERGAAQALMLMNGTETEAMTSPGQSEFLAALSAPFFSDEQRLETLYLATLSRFPSGDELSHARPYFEGAESAKQRRLLLGDVLWALVNSAEFTLNH